jgi:hypothetical protein
MSTFTKRNWLRRLAQTLRVRGLTEGFAAAGLMAAGLATPAALSAQEVAAPPTKSFLNKAAITLPVQLEDRYRAQLKSIQLYVKETPSSPWKLQEQAAPTQQAFIYKASADGEYGFNIVSVDTTGRSFPADVTKEGPALVVVIDTQSPEVAVERVSQTPEGHVVKCTARDAHLDAAKTKVFYQAADQTWRDLAAQPGKADTFLVPASAPWNGMIRAVAVDLANNNTTREVNLGSTPAVAAAAAAAPGTAPATAGPSFNTATPPLQAPKLPAAVATTNHETLVIVDPVTLQPQGPAQPITPHPAPLPAALPQPTPMLPRPSGGPIPPLAAVNAAQAPASPGTAGPTPVTPAPATPPAPAPAPSKLGTSIVHKLPILDPAPPRTAPAPEPKVERTPRSLPASVQEVNATALQSNTTALPSRDVQPPVAQAPVAQRQLLNATRTFVDYKVEALGASGVGKVEVWCTRDQGKTWIKVGEDTDRQSPVEVNLPGEGVWGVILAVSNGRGFGGNPPRPGETPDYWVEIDTARPVADITAIHASDDGALHISWAAKDKNLAQEPIELSYAAKREGPWHSIAKGIRNDGTYRWMPPAELGPHAFFRMTVKDEAGNVTQSETTQPVPLDDQSRPRGRVLGISTAATPRPSNAPASRVSELPPPRTTDVPLPQR